jgi:hypothetical protein
MHLILLAAAQLVAQAQCERVSSFWRGASQLCDVGCKFSHVRR